VIGSVFLQRVCIAAKTIFPTQRAAAHE